MLIKRNQLAQGIWCELLDQNRVRRAVTFENTVWNERIGRAFSFGFLRRFTESQGFGLGENIRQQHIVMPAERIERLDKRDEVTRNQPCPLVNQLIKGVLAVRSWFTPIDRPGWIVDFSCFERNVFAVTLHG